MSASEPQSPTPSPKDKRFGFRISRSGSQRGPSGLQLRFTDVLAWVITIAWAASFLLDMVKTNYDPPASIHALMLMVAGAAFASNLIKKPGDDGK